MRTNQNRSADDIATLVARSRAAQGLPPTVEDLAVIERVARVLELIDPQTAEPDSDRLAG